MINKRRRATERLTEVRSTQSNPKKRPFCNTTDGYLSVAAGRKRQSFAFV